jgi:hypothetical protein
MITSFVSACGSARSTATFHWPIARVRGPAPAACRHDMLTSVREIESDLSRLAKEPLHQTPLRWGRACSHCCMGLTTLLPTMPLSWDWTGFSGTSGRVRSYEPQIIGRLTCVPVAVDVAVPRCLFTILLVVPSPPDLYSACTREI